MIVGFLVRKSFRVLFWESFGLVSRRGFFSSLDDA